MIKQYPKYKDSGIEWIGEIPDHWDIKPLKFTDKVIMGQSPSSDDYNANFIGRPFLQGNADFTTIHPIPKIWCESSNKIAFENDILLSVRAPVGAINIADQEYGIGRGLCAIRAKNTNYKCLYYLFSILDDELNSIATGSTYVAISVDDVRSFRIPLPKFEDQGSLVKYLNDKTHLIDNLIGKKKLLIEKLKEYRTAMINQAVTKGLDPNVTMKDSGIEWLGEMPKHWAIMPHKRLLKEGKEGIKIGPFGSSLKLEIMKKKGFKVYGQENVISNDFQKGKRYIDDQKFNELSVYKIVPGDIIVTMMGTTGNAKVVPKNIQEGIMDSHLIRLRYSEFIEPMFMELLLNDSYYIFNRLKMESKGSIMEGLNSTIIKSLIMATPPLEDQVRIMDYLNLQNSRIEALLKKELNLIELLKEKRTALISEVVTGKIDVRDEKIN